MVIFSSFSDTRYHLSGFTVYRQLGEERGSLRRQEKTPDMPGHHYSTSNQFTCLGSPPSSVAGTVSVYTWRSRYWRLDRMRSPPRRRSRSDPYLSTVAPGLYETSACIVTTFGC